MKTLLYYYLVAIEEAVILVGANQLDEGTLRHYKVRKKTLTEFLKTQNLTDISPKEITLLFCKRFETWLLCHKKHNINYANKHLQHLGKCLNYAQMDEVLTHNVMSTFKYKYNREIKLEYITITELRKLEKYPFTGVLDRVRDLYVFSCYTGLSYNDIMRFDVTNDIVINQYGVFIAQKRGKTGNEAIIPVVKNAEQILNKYNNQLPKMTNQCYNKFLKRVFKELLIYRSLGTHSARKTFGMLMHNHFQQPLDTVSRMLGHKSIKTTQSWYVKTDFKKIATDMREVVNVLRIGA